MGNGHHVLGLSGRGDRGAIPLIRGLGGILVEPIGFIMMNIKVPGVEGYDEDQIAIMMDDPGMTE